MKATGDSEKLEQLSARAMWLPLVVVIALLAILAIGPLVVSSRVRAVRSTLIDVVDPARLHASGLSAALAEEMFAVAMRASSPGARLEPRYQTALRDERSHAVALDSLVRALSPDVVERVALYRESAARWHDDVNDISERVPRRADLDTARRDGLSALDAAGELIALLEQEYIAGRQRVRRIESLDVLLPVGVVPLALIACVLVLRAGRRTMTIALRAEHDRLALAQTLELKTALMRGISHDLQNPLGAARGYADLVLDGVVKPGDQRDVLIRLRLLLTDAVDTVRDLLAVARSDDGAIKIDRRHVALAQIAKSAVEDHALAARTRNQTVASVVHSDCPVYADVGRVRHIIDNLLSNASKYSPEGGRIQVLIAKRETEGKSWCTLTVSDSGPGIPADAAPHVFEEFYRVPSLREVAPGTGIGLSVSRRIARLMGGDVTLDSSAPVGGDPDMTGASFTLWLSPDDVL